MLHFCTGGAIKFIFISISIFVSNVKAKLFQVSNFFMNQFPSLSSFVNKKNRVNSPVDLFWYLSGNCCFIKAMLDILFFSYYLNFFSIKIPLLDHRPPLTSATSEEAQVIFFKKYIFEIRVFQQKIWGMSQLSHRNFH